MARLTSRCRRCGKVFHVNPSVMTCPHDDPRVLHLQQEFGDESIIRLGDNFETTQEKETHAPSVLVTVCRNCRKIFHVDRSVMRNPYDDPRVLHLQLESNDRTIIRLGNNFEEISQGKTVKADSNRIEISVDDFGCSLRTPLRFSKQGQARKIEGGSRRFEVKKCASIVPSNSKGDKVAVLEELEFEDGSKELRLGYYIIGHRGRVKGKWAWGQYALFIPAEDLTRLTGKGKEKGIL